MKQELQIDGKVLLGTKLVADTLGCSINTVPEMVKRGLLPQPVLIGRQKYYQKDLVEHLLAKGE